MGKPLVRMEQQAETGTDKVNEHRTIPPVHG
jgi:hypothetical protein